MKVLDLDMDYFMKEVAAGISETSIERRAEDDYGKMQRRIKRHGV